MVQIAWLKRGHVNCDNYPIGKREKSMKQKSLTNSLPDLLIGDCATSVTPMSVIWLAEREKNKTLVHKENPCETTIL